MCSLRVYSLDVVIFREMLEGYILNFPGYIYRVYVQGHVGYLIRDCVVLFTNIRWCKSVPWHSLIKCYCIYELMQERHNSIASPLE